MSAPVVDWKSKSRQISVRVSTPFWEWLQHVAQAERMGLPDVIDRSLRDYARGHGYSEPPPRRP